MSLAHKINGVSMGIRPLRALSLTLITAAGLLFWVPTDSSALIPRGGVSTGGGGGTGDPAIAPVGQWAKWTGTSQGSLIAQYPASTNDQTGCNNYEGANPAACGQNVAGNLSLTASASGTTLTVTGISALTTGSTTLNNGDVIADPATLHVTPGTVVASGGPCVSASLPCTLTLNQNVGTIASETMVTNPPALQASTLSTTINNNLPDLLGFSGPIADPGQGCMLVWQPGGHAASQTNGLTSLCIADVETANGPANYTLQQPPSLLYPLSWGLAGSPNYIGQTVGLTYQTAGSGPPPDFYNGPNSNGVAGPVVVHQYNFNNTFLSGWASLAVDGGGSGGRNGADNIGAGWFVDTADNSLHGPIHLANSTSGSVTFHGLDFGYAPRFSSTTAPGGSSAFGPDGNEYAMAPDDSPGPILGELTCPFGHYQNACFGGSTGWSIAGNTGGSGCWPDLEPALVINDPGNPGALLYMQYGTATVCTGGGSGTVGSGHLEIITNVGGTTAYHNLAITGTIPTWLGACSGGNNCEFRLAYDYDDNTILVSDGSWHLAAFTLSYSAGVYSASSQDLSSTLGSAPPDPTTVSCTAGGGASNVNLFYMNRNAYHMAVMSFCGDIYAYTISHACPTSGTPTPDGSIITAPNACTIKDTSGNSWIISSTANTTEFGDQRQANYQITKNGTYTLAGYKLQVAQTGQIFNEQACGTMSVWQDSSGRQVPSPTGAGFINHAVATTPSNSWLNLAQAESSGTITTGQTITIQKQSGVNFWGGDYGSIGRDSTVNNVTITGQSGAAMYCGQGQNGEIIGQDPASSNLTVSNLDLGFNHATDFNGPDACIEDKAGATNMTVTNVYAHDCDMGILAGGLNGTITLTNDVFDHNGGDAGSGAASHNIYISIHASPLDTAILAVSGGGSYCMKNLDNTATALSGFEFKSRVSQGSIQNFTVGEPSQHGYTDCKQSTSVDLSCGGAYTFGGTINGTGVVIELGPDTESGPNGLIRFGAETGATGNCPTGGTGYPTNTLLIQGSDSTHPCWLINDYGLDVPVVYQYSHAWSVTVKNCKIVNPHASSLADALGVGVTDGGGNTLYHSRADAGLSPYPFLPAPL